MRLNRLLPYVLLLAACGDNTPGAAPIHTVDAAKQIDAPMIDAPMQIGHNGRVWAIGAPGADADGAVAFGFDDGIGQLPFNPTTLPSFQVPGGTSRLQPKSGTVTQIFDSNGSKIAFIADKTTAGTFDLYVADVDGSNATMLVSGTDTTLGVLTIQQVQLSPDGTKAAFTRAVGAAAVGGFDLFMVNTTGTPTPVQLSPADRLAGTATNVISFSWSADSKFVAFSGDLHVDKVTEAFIIDTTAATPTAVAVLDSTALAGATGVSGGISFDGNDNIYFSALNTTTAGAPFLLFTATSAGTGLTNPTFVPARTDMTVADVGSVGVTPDGKTLVFAADAPVAAAQNLFAVDLSAATPTAAAITDITAIATLSLHPSFSAPFWFSPDGKSVAVLANWKADLTNMGKSRSEPFVISLDGLSGARRLVDIIDHCLASGGGAATIPPQACDVSTIQWTKDSASVYIHGDILVNNDTSIFKADPTMTDQTPTHAFDVTASTGAGTGGDFFQMVLR